MFVGCSPQIKAEEREPWWSLWLITKYELNSETVAAGAMDSLMEALKVKVGTHKIEYEPKRDGTSLQLLMRYQDYATFRAFHGLDADIGKVDWKYRETAFLRETTHKHENPWKVLESNSFDRVIEINNEVVKCFTLAPTNQTEYFYMLRSAVRRTNVPGAYKKVDNFDSYDYYFKGLGEGALEYITVYDRRANPAIWYVLGVGATAVFMAGAYLVFRATARRKENNVQTLQSGVQYQTYTEDSIT